MVDRIAPTLPRPRHTDVCLLAKPSSWFSIITQKAIRRGSFKNVKDLIANIQNFTDP